MRDYAAPERLPGEGNWAWCQRYAEAIPPEAIVRALVARFVKLETKGRRLPAWSRMGSLLGHGSGVSSAIVEKYLPKEGPDAP